MIENIYSILLQDSYGDVNKVRADLIKSIQFSIDNGATGFLLSVEGYFNKMALNICREFRKKYPYLSIRVVITDLNMHFQRETKKYKKLHNYYKDASILLYCLSPNQDKIFQINKFIVNQSLWCICYINKTVESFFKTLSYKHYINVINLKTLQKLCYHKKNDELPHQILKSIII